MKTYYTDRNGRLFYAYTDCSERRIFKEFNRTRKAWEGAEPDDGQNQMTEITKEAAMDRVERCLLDSLDPGELRDCIEYLCRNRKTEWEASVEAEDGTFILGFPRLPDGLYNVFGLLGFDYDYRMEMENWPSDLRPTDMNARQIRTVLSYFENSMRFYEEDIASALDDGTLLKLLFRLEDLLNAYRGTKLHW